MINKVNEIISNYKFDLLNKRNVVGMGLGYKEVNGLKTDEKSVVVLVKKKVKLEKMDNKDVVPQSIKGVKTDIIEVGQLQFLKLRTERIRPVQPGISIGHYKISAGTLGAIVKDKKNGDLLMLSNNHVLANISNGNDDRAKKGDEILQPGVYDGGTKEQDVVGHLERLIPIRRGSDVDCPRARNFEKLLNEFLYTIRPNYGVKLFKKGVENTVDCAVAKPIDGNIIDNNILDIGKVRGVVQPKLGMKIKKSGRTTAISKGEIKLINAVVEVQITETESAVFSEQIITTPMSSPGDSGSLVLDSNNKAVGLLFAGSNKATICNDINNVLNSLDVEF